MSTASADIFPWIGITILALTGIALTYRALWWDRARRGGALRHRCPACWYARGDDLTRCPECGHVPRSARDLRRTRRSWRAFVLAVLCFALAWSAVIWRRTGRLTSLIPSTALVVMPMDAYDWYESVHTSAPLGPAQDELARRAESGELWTWQERILVERILDNAGRQDRAWRGDARGQNGDPRSGRLLFGVHDAIEFLPAPRDRVQDLPPGCFDEPSELSDRERAWDELIQVLESIVFPDTWMDNGGTQGSMWLLGDRLAVLHTREAHDAIHRLLAEMRAATFPVGRPAEQTESDDGMERRIFLLPPRWREPWPEAEQELVDRIVEIEPDHWRLNGGNEGELYILGRYIVIITRPRNFPMVEAILSE